MSKLLIKRRAFSQIDIYGIYGEKEEPRYYVKANFLTLAHRLHVYDYWTKQEIGLIQQKPVAWMGMAEIISGEEIVGTVTRKFSLGHPKFSIDFNGWQVEGWFWEWDYTIIDKNSARIATVSKQHTDSNDACVLTIYNDSDERDVLIMVLTIDILNNGQI